MDEDAGERFDREWFAGANLGLATGLASGLAVLDIDPRNGGDEALAELLEKYGPLPATLEVATGGGGRHYYFTLDYPLRKGVLAPGVELYADGGQVVAPPSKHRAGNRYRFVDDGVQLAPLPEWAASVVGTVAATTRDPEAKILAGARHQTLLAMAGSMRRVGFTVAAIEAGLLAVNEERCEPPLARDDVLDVASRAPHWEMGAPSLPDDDLSWVALPNVGSREPEPATRPEWVEAYKDLSFPMSVFPEAVRGFIERTAVSLSMDSDTIAALTLPVFGTALGNSREIWLRPDYPERSRIWVAMLADPSQKKTPAIKRVVAPLSAIQRDMDRRWREKLALWTQTAPKDRDGARPFRGSLVIKDATVAAMAREMQRYPRGCLLDPDELTSWLGSFDEFKGSQRGSDRGRWLSMWSGGTWDVVRRGDEDPIIVADSHVSILGGIQPEVAGRLLDGRDGLPYRFLFCCPGKRRGDARAPSVPLSVTNDYEEIVRTLSEFRGDAERPPGLRIEGEAWEEAADYVQRLYDEQHERELGALPNNLVDYWGKLEAYFGRILLILTELWHVCENNEEKITVDLVRAAGGVVNHFKGQAIEVLGDQRTLVGDYRAFDRPGVGHVEEVCRLLRGFGGRATMRDVQKASRALKKLRSDGMGEVVREAEARGLLRAEVEQRRGPATIWLCLSERV